MKSVKLKKYNEIDLLESFSFFKYIPLNISSKSKYKIGEKV